VGGKISERGAAGQGGSGAGTFDVTLDAVKRAGTPACIQHTSGSLPEWSFGPLAWAQGDTFSVPLPRCPAVVSW
jgi:hypothetical protein